MSFSEKIPNLLRLGRSLREKAIRAGRWLRHRIPIAISNTLCFLRQCAFCLGRLVRRRARAVFFTLVCLVTLIALFVAEENYRTGKAWEKYEADARARGEKLTLAELAPLPVPDDQNFAMTPLIKSIFSDPKDKTAEVHLPSLYDLKNDENYPVGGLGNWNIAQKADLAAWKAYLQPSDLLTAFKKLEPKMAEISAAIRRPYSRFPSQPVVKLPDTAAAYVPQMVSISGLSKVTTMIGLSRLFKLRAIAELDAGQSDRALDDAITSVRLAHALDGGDLLSTLTEVAQYGMAWQVVWEGLAANRWSEPQLAALQQELEKIDLFPQFQLSLQRDEVRFLRAEELQKNQNFFVLFKSYKRTFKGMTGADPDFSTFFSTVFFPAAMPAFVLSRAQLESADYYDNHVLPCINISARTIDPEAAKVSEAFGVQLSRERNRWLHPQIIYEDYLKDSSDVLRTFANVQSRLDEATLACALERFKLAHGDYPAKLDELAPKFIEKLPHDVINGEPLHYQRTSDGRFMLYSVGWDGVDNHGTPDDGNGSYQGKDWVWQYSPAK